MKAYNVSIHFQTKSQTAAEANEKLQIFINRNEGNLPFDFSERLGSTKKGSSEWSYDEPMSVLHHCFLPKKDLVLKGYNTEVYELLEELSDNVVCWSGVTAEGTEYDRYQMLRIVAQTKGLSIFIGKIEGGVKIEYDIAKELGINTLCIEYLPKNT